MTISYLPLAAFSFDRLANLWSIGHHDVFWRHDVDHDLACALAMATAEHQAGISATYYLRVDNETYETTGAEFDATTRMIIELGHTLGVHVDLGLPRSVSVTDEFLSSSCELARLSLAHLPVGQRVSFHRPPDEVLWRRVEGFEHALGPAWLGHYVSDSRQRFRQSPEELLATGGPAQVNLHPLWWFMAPERARRIRLEHEAAALRELKRGEETSAT